MAFVEDFSLFLADFGVDGTLAGQPVRVIFDEPADVQIGQRTVQPQVQIQTAQVPASYLGAQLVCPQGTFQVMDHLPDGTGMSLLLLTRVS